MSSEPTNEMPDEAGDCEDEQELCPECQAIFDHWDDRHDWETKHPGFLHRNIIDLKMSARNGCPVCALFIQDLDAEAIRFLEQNNHKSKGRVLVGTDAYVAIERYKITIMFDTQMDLSSESPSAAVEVFRSVNNSSVKTGTIHETADCEENWKLVQEWLSSCREHHPDCSKHLTQKIKPSRLLDIGNRDTELRLSLTTNLPPEIEYLTLSHCWGGKVFTTLRKENYESFLAQIPTADLSKTFRDALVATRKLGFRYLWIDSLCIIQGDETDWGHEATLMGYIYGNSTLNLTALDSSNGDYGLFLKRKAGQLNGCKVRTRGDDDSIKGSIWTCTILNMSLKLTTGVLTSRAWVYQELILAPRSLYFGAKELIFTCRQSKASETFPDSYDDGLTVLSGHVSSLRDTHGSRATKIWQSIVTSYSSGSLTFSRDKLVAIAGLARVFATLLNLPETSYLAGIWEDGLVENLIWYNYRQEVLPSTSVYQAPSWSWAAVNVPVIFFTRFASSIVPLASLLEKTLSTASDPFREVAGGYIRLSCQVPCVGVLCNKQPDIFPDIESRTGTWETFLYLDNYPYTVEGDIYFFPLLRFSENKSPANLCGLVLKYVDEKGHYSRVGCFLLNNQDGIDRFQNIQRREWNDGENQFKGERTGPDEDGNEMCIITIV